jgi:hypothetical protein
MLITAFILLSAIALTIQVKTAKADVTPAMYAYPATKSITAYLPSTGPIQRYNISIMVANLTQCLTVACSVSISDYAHANITNYYKGAGFFSLGFSIFTAASWNKTGSNLKGLTAGSISAVDITDPIEIFKIEVEVKSFNSPILVDVYYQYAGDIHNVKLLPGNDCPNDHTIYMNAITTQVITVDSTDYNVTALSNSTIPTMTIDTNAKSLNFTTSGTDGTTGYVNVTIPKTLLDCPEGLTYWHVLMDNTDLTGSAIITQNSTHTFVYLAYSQSAHDIHITGTYVVPEYPSIAILVTFLTMMTVAFALLRKVHKKRWQTL